MNEQVARVGTGVVELLLDEEKLKDAQVRWVVGCLARLLACLVYVIG